MNRPPELILGYEEDAVPRSAVCCICGQQMPDPTQGPLSATECYAWYSAQFQQHVRQRHPVVGHIPVSDASKRPSTIALVA
jgi:hypothetical protein